MCRATYRSPFSPRQMTTALYRCRLLHHTLDDKQIRRQDAVFVISRIADNLIGQPLAWNFVRAQVSTIMEK